MLRILLKIAGILFLVCSFLLNRKGKIESIEIKVEQRMGNKKVLFSFFVFSLCLIFLSYYVTEQKWS